MTAKRLFLPVLICVSIATWGGSAAARHDSDRPPIIKLDPPCENSPEPVSGRHSIAVEGYYFSPSVAVTIVFAAGKENAETFPKAATTDREGHFSATIQPLRRGQGDYLVRAMADKHDDAHARFDVPCRRLQQYYGRPCRECESAPQESPDPSPSPSP
ncbi:MAG: hypothetical protein ACRDJF_04050, partial [Actinomycetota bacterium]